MIYKKLSKFGNSIKPKVGQALLFFLAAVTTLIITSIYNWIVPNESSIGSEATDTTTVVNKHDNSTNSTSDLKNRTRSENIKSLESYESETITKQIESKAKSDEWPNLILPKAPISISSWTNEKASSFFKMDCPENSHTDFVDFKLMFFNNEIIKEIGVIRVLIYRFNSKGERTVYLDRYYETVDKSENLIRLNNDFEKGRYEMNVGFIFKHDFKKFRPKFYNQKCILEKQSFF